MKLWDRPTVSWGRYAVWIRATRPAGPGTRASRRGSLVHKQRARLHVQRQLVVVELERPLENRRVAGARAGSPDAEPLLAEHAVFLEAVRDEELLNRCFGGWRALRAEGVW